MDTNKNTNRHTKLKNIILVGFMGTGKTAVAKRLARRLGMEYASTDDIIEEREGVPIHEIFAKKGEPYFRKVEKEVVRDVSARKNLVIATGGGVVLDEENMGSLKASGPVICLNASEAEILERTGRHSHRPLLNVPDPLARIRELLKAREPYYRKADHQIDTSGKSLDEIVDEAAGIAKGS